MFGGGSARKARRVRGRFSGERWHIVCNLFPRTRREWSNLTAVGDIFIIFCDEIRPAERGDLTLSALGMNVTSDCQANLLLSIYSVIDNNISVIFEANPTIRR